MLGEGGREDTNERRGWVEGKREKRKGGDKD